MRGQLSSFIDREAVALDEIRYDDLLADKQTLDYVVRAVCLERDCDYLTALEDLQGWRDQCEGEDSFGYGNARPARHLRHIHFLYRRCD